MLPQNSLFTFYFSIQNALHNIMSKSYRCKLGLGRNLSGIQSEEDLIRNLQWCHVNEWDRFVWEKGGRPWISCSSMMLSVLTKPLESENDQQDRQLLHREAHHI